MTREPASYRLDPFMDVLAALLGEDGCPWDKAQTASTLCDYVIEEAFELTEAIRDQDPQGIREEMGDVLFILCFLIVLMERNRTTTFPEIAGTLVEKMVRRHPHVFEKSAGLDLPQIWSNWEKIKKKEKKSYSVLGGIPKGLPPLLKAHRIHAKAARAGFTWKDEEAVAGQLAREWEEFAQARAAGDEAAIREEFGDYLFTLVEYGRRLGIKCDEALAQANTKFIKRFSCLEKTVKSLGLSEPTMEQLNAVWDECKRR